MVNIKADKQLDTEYMEWLENMLILLSKCYVDLVRESNEEVLEKALSIGSDEARHATRMIAGRAKTDSIKLPDGQIDRFSEILIQKYPSSEPKELS